MGGWWTGGEDAAGHQGGGDASEGRGADPGDPRPGAGGSGEEGRRRKEEEEEGWVQEIERRERELDAQVRRPAEAEKYRLEKLAEAGRQRAVLEAEAKAESEKLRGEAEAFAIQARAAAEAEQMRKKAEAWKEYKEAAMVNMVLEALPKVTLPSISPLFWLWQQGTGTGLKVAAEVAAPLTAGMEKVTMVSSGDGPLGAAKITGEIMEIVAGVPDIVSKMTGVDIASVHFTPSSSSSDANYNQGRLQTMKVK